MLLGYDKNKNVKFIFTDENYLSQKYPNNTAKISNFWKFNHGLTEFFIDKKDFLDWPNYRQYKIIDNQLVKQQSEEEKNVNR